MSKIMITGATGKLGGWTIEHLLNKKGVLANQIVALVRDKNKAEHLAEKGIELRVGSYDDPNSLNSALQGISKLLFISSAELDNGKRLDQNHNVVMAAKAANVEYIAFVGVADPDLRIYGLEDVDMATEHAICAVGIPYTFLRNSTYLDEITLNLKSAAKTGDLVSSTNGEKFNWVLRKDLALANATVLTEEGHKNKTYELIRSKSISFPEIASLLSHSLQKEITLKELPSDLAIESLKEAGANDIHAFFLISTFHKAIADEKFLTTSTDLENLLGDQLTPLDKSIELLLK